MSDSGIDWKSLCEEADKEMEAAVVVYEFSNGRKFTEKPEDAAIVPGE